MTRPPGCAVPERAGGKPVRRATRRATGADSPLSAAEVTAYLRCHPNFLSDNPDITDYMGHGEVRAAWQRNDHVVTMMIRNQLESGFEDGAVELSWSFPVFNYPYLKGYLQYFYGYGESLIDYNNKVNRIGLGISVTDWLD